jgi:hypothetical protein
MELGELLEDSVKRTVEDCVALMGLEIALPVRKSRMGLDVSDEFELCFYTEKL